MAQVFVSYSHRDRKWFDRLQVHLKPLERSGFIDLWDDRRIAPGSDWEQEIRTALEEAEVAILLVSADFLATDFIAEDVLPPLLAKAKARQTVVLPILVSPSRYREVPGLSRLQSVNPPSRPLVGLSRWDQEETLAEVSRMVMSAVREREPDPATLDPAGFGQSAPRDAAEVQQLADPLTAARQRGEAMREEILQLEGGALAANQVADLLNISEAVVDARRRAGTLIGLDITSGTYVYPAWQVSRQGMLPGLEAALSDLTIVDPWMRAAFFLSGDPRLKGETPLDELRRGNIAAVRRAARAYGEHGAA